MSRFDSFVILAGMRTGSNFLEVNLNRLEGVTCHGEAFNPSFMGHAKAESLLGFDLDQREADPNGLLSAIRDSDHMAGFRLFQDHDQRVIRTVLDDPRCAKIVLTRNPLDSYVSWKIARETGQWKLTNATHAKSVAVDFDADEFEAYLERVQSFQDDIRRALQSSGQTAFYIDYDDLRDVAIINGIAAFLGVEDRLDNINKKLKKQNPGLLQDKVTNFDEMQDALAAQDWFAQWRSPVFEPQRGPAIPSYIAAAKSGLLYAPLRSGPDRAIADWFAALDNAAPLRKFSQRSLRDWQETRLPHRSFAVLRHPVARAHAAFCDCILNPRNERFAEIRTNLQRVHKIALPEGADPTEHRQAFLSFLAFLKVNLSGQTSIRVDPAWASQSVLLQGIAQFASPDLILREEELPQALPQLAATVGRDDVPAFAPAPHADEPMLRAIYDTRIERAARDAYARDYQLFGFKDWA